MLIHQRIELPGSLSKRPGAANQIHRHRATLPGVATTPDDPTRLDPSPKSAGSNPSGWLSSSGSIDHGRFDPGALLGGRYRIVGKLGRGGMGEVYRADDLKLGQPVALKFLPPDVDRDPGRLMQLHNEVRLARQVSHPNVCRVYDIDEVDGHTFLSMEYVDGEDLAALLRRIGRFPEERGLEIARQVCAGLAGAHERGVIHRLVATMAALATHFIFLRAPLTTELNSWRGPIGYWFLGTVALLGLGACYIARSSVARTIARAVEQPQAV